MKKIYFAMTAILVSGVAGAQILEESAPKRIAPQSGVVELHTNQTNEERAAGDPIANDDFSNAANWNTPTDANGHAFQIVTSTPAALPGYWGSMASTTAGNGFAIFNGIQYLIPAPGNVNPQDVLLEYIPVLDCTSKPNVTLQFEQRYRAYNSDKVFVEVSGNNGTSWTVWELNADEPTNGVTIQETYTMDISAVAGNQSQVKIRFRWLETSDNNSFGSGYAWGIDDFKVSEAWDYDQANSGSFARSGGAAIGFAPGIQYFMVPTSQLTPITFSGNTTNLGAQVQTGAKLNVEVTKGGVVFTGTSATTNLAVGATDSLVASTTLTPANGLGFYDISMWFNGTNTEQVTSNDTMFTFIEVTENTYARDNGIQIAGIDEVTTTLGGSFSIGNVYEFFGPGVIGAVDVFITDLSTNDDAGQLIFAEVYKWNGTEYTLQSASEDYEIQPADLDGFIKLVLTDPVTVAAGDDILVVSAHYGGTPIEIGTAQPTDVGTVAGFTNGSFFNLSSPTTPMVRVDMIDYSAIEEQTATTFTIGQNVPNPFDNSSVITYTLNETSNVSVQITDVTGKVVQTITPGNQVAGTYTMTIDAATLADGMYFYTFTVGNEIVTKQMVVSKK